MIKAMKNWQLFWLLMELYVVFRFCSSKSITLQVEDGEDIDDEGPVIAPVTNDTVCTNYRLFS